MEGQEMLSDLARTGTLEDVRSQVAGKKRRLRRWATVAVAASAVVFGASTPAHADIHLPNPFSCAWNRMWSGDFLYLKVQAGVGGWGPVCFVDAGTTNVDISNVVGLHTGNNAGIIASDQILRPFSKWEDDFNYYGTVKVLTIY